MNDFIDVHFPFIFFNDRINHSGKPIAFKCCGFKIKLQNLYKLTK